MQSVTSWQNRTLTILLNDSYSSISWV